jgi:hypothetical protein
MGMLSMGEPYYGDAKIFGKTYDAGYEPIKDASSTVIGAYYVGYPKRYLPNQVTNGLWLGSPPGAVSFSAPELLRL